MPSALEILLARLANQRNMPLPEPAAPMNLGPLSTDTSAAFGAQNPEPVMPRFTQPAQPDMNFVNQFAGPAPTAPVERAPSTLDKIAAVLQGVAYGPQGVEQIRQQRNAPFEQYRRDSAAYEQRRAQAFELAERRAEREADRMNRQNEMLHEREYRAWLQKNSDRTDEQKERMRQAFILQRDANAARLEAERDQQRELRARQDDARQRAGILGTGPGAAPPHIAKELGDYYANITHALSPAAARWQNAQARRADALARGGGGGGSKSGGANSAAQAALDRFNLAQQGMDNAIQRGDKQAEKAYREAMNRAYKSLARFPRDIEIREGGGGTPYAYLRGSEPAPLGSPGSPYQGPPVPQQPQQQQPQGPTRTRAQIRAAASAAGISEAEAIKRAQAAGFTITQ